MNNTTLQKGATQPRSQHLMRWISLIYPGRRPGASAPVLVDILGPHQQRKMLICCDFYTHRPFRTKAGDKLIHKIC